MSANVFELVKEGLHPRLASVLPELLPGGRQSGGEYVCGSLQGGPGDSCKTNLETGRGSDFSTGESWGDVIGLWAKIRGIGQGEAARELADKYGISLGETLTTQGKTLNEQQHALAVQREAMNRQQEQIRQMTSDLQALTLRLHDVSAVYKSLEPLLPRLNSLLSGR